MDGRIVKYDSQLLHEEVVKPALALLQGSSFEGAESEFLQAHDHYRKGNNEDAITWACKAFESTMKTICDRKRWPYQKDKDTASALIKVILENGLLPGYTGQGFTGVRTVLESALPTARNRSGGHGAGSEPREVPDHLAAYALHIAGANIVLMVEAFKKL